jgi:hypothetical protein
VPLEALEGVTPATTSALAEHGINDIDTLAATSVDDLTEHLDISLDEAQAILTSAQAVVAARDKNQQAGEDEEEAAEGAAASPAAGAGGDGDEGGATEAASQLVEAVSGTAVESEQMEQNAASEEFDPTIEAGEVEPSEEMIAEGYDEAVRQGVPFHAEENIRAGGSADPVAVTEADPITADELALQGAGRDLRPDTITPAPDITSSEAAVIETSGAAMDDVREEADEMEEDDSPFSPAADLGGEASAPEVQAGSSYASENTEASAPGKNSTVDGEPNDASANAE